MIKRVLPSLFLFLAFFSLRLQTVADMNLTIAHWSSVGMDLSLLYDFVTVLVPILFSYLFFFLGAVPRKWIWIIFAYLIWTLSLCNVLYFGFFGTALEFWMVKVHWSDAFEIGGAGLSLAISKWIGLSTVFIIAAVLSAWKWMPTAENSKKMRLRALAQTAGLLVAVLLLQQSPVWFNRVNFERETRTGEISVLSDLLLLRWFDELTGSLHNLRQEIRKDADFFKEKGITPGEILKLYAEMTPEDQKRIEAAKDPGIFKEILAGKKTENPDWPMYRELPVVPGRGMKIRKDLGLPTDRPVHIVILMLESTRILELEHPVLGTKILPRMNQLFKDKGVYFTSTYSSSGELGLTARGKFSTSCSFLPNINGIAPFIGHLGLRIKCLSDLLPEVGYENLWANAYHIWLHNMGMFEKLHGVTRLYDLEYFKTKDIKPRGTWGLDDYGFLMESLKLLNQTAEIGKPVLASVLTISSTHFPHLGIPEMPVPQDLEAQYKMGSNYGGYLSGLKYLDQSVDDFVRKLFDSPMGDNTLVVLLGDHSINTKHPMLNLDPVQTVEFRFRIPLVFLTKNMPHPRKISYPVHQIDIAPTLAEIAGFKGKTAWLGRNLFSGEGSPWVFRDEKELSYRTANMGCYTKKGEKRPTCYDLSGGKDVLFNTGLKEVPEKPMLSTFFDWVVRATRQAITSNKIQP